MKIHDATDKFVEYLRVHQNDVQFHWRRIGRNTNIPCVPTRLPSSVSGGPVSIDNFQKDIQHMNKFFDEILILQYWHPDWDEHSAKPGADPSVNLHLTGSFRKKLSQ
jgi:hypothetical protein